MAAQETRWLAAVRGGQGSRGAAARRGRRV